MNIQISKINNGWITAVSAMTPQGPQNTATYSVEFDGVIAELTELGEFMKQQPPQIVPGSPEDR